MKPKGHKRGCGCVLCARPKKRVSRKNHGYEHQATTLHERARKNSAVRMSRNPAGSVCECCGRKTAARKSNPAHWPRTGRGPKGNSKWYIIDLFGARDSIIRTSIRQATGAAASTEAASMVGRRVSNRVVHRVELSGPYSRKPTPSTVRK